MFSKQELHEYASSIAEICADLLINHGMVRRPETFRRKLTVKVRKMRSGGCGGVRGGIPTITIADRYINEIGLFWEYPSHREDPEIGEFYSEDPTDHIKAIVAHEIAHAADHWSGNNTNHGSEWKWRYRMLRRELGLLFS